MPTRNRGQEFADLTHNVLVDEERYSLKLVASRMNMDYDTLYGRLRNRVIFAAEEIRALMAAAPDPRFASFLLSGTPFVPADRSEEKPDVSPRDTLRDSALRMLLEASDAAHAIAAASTDGRIDHREAIKIMDEIANAERAIATLREHVRRSVRTDLEQPGQPDGDREAARRRKS